MPDRFAPPTYAAGLVAPVPVYRGQQQLDGSSVAVYGGGPVIDDSGVYSALPGTPPPWNDYEDEREMTMQPSDAAATAAAMLQEFPRERLRFVEELGEGLFGEVDIFVLATC